MEYMSLFSGIGGFELGFPACWQCVGFSEIDKYASQIYLKRFGRHKQYGDITRIDTAELPDFELLCGGFPCQAFSIAGKRRGFEDTRGTLFFQICRIAKD
jgi:DNA (cytosine-5)-methyltransferase 1